MKKFIIIIVSINLSLVLLLAGLYFLAETYPVHPGNPLFGLQSFAENQQIRLTGDPVRQAERHFELVERRLADLAMVDQKGLEPALKAFDLCLTAAIDSLQNLPAEESQAIYTQIQNMMVRAEIVLTGVEDQISPEYKIVLDNKFAALQSSTFPVLIPISGTSPTIPSTIIDKIIPFLGKDVDHGEFPMDGGHAAIECLDCHNDGVYTDTPVDCASCHILERELDYAQTVSFNRNMENHDNYPKIYADDCGDCHTVQEWSDLEFDHTNAATCQSCHEEDLPEIIPVTSEQLVKYSVVDDEFKPNTAKEEHYPGECSDCHTDITSWEEYTFDHYQSDCAECHTVDEYDDQHILSGECLNSETCESCHQYTQHEEEYYGSCSTCHEDVEDWLTIEVDHSEYTNCYDCHTDDKPADHYYSNCSTCHNTVDWNQGYFNHDPASTCTTCHVEPENHYGSDCLTCHTMDTWENGRFPHTFDNCTSCHSTPANHYPATCTTCHTTQSWHTISYDHTELTLCTQCHATPTDHYNGSCTNCHDISNWNNVAFNHIGLTDCLQCHAAPGGHYAGTCSNCHNTLGWNQINFDHTGLTFCEGCHNGPEGHYTASCSSCHTTTGWMNITYQHNDNDNCTNCHEKEGHWPGQCSKCHITSDWSVYTFDHTGYNDCKSCHERPTGHSRGQCSKCHTTNNWIPKQTPTPTETPTDEPDDPKILFFPSLTPVEGSGNPITNPTSLPVLMPTPTIPPMPTQIPTEVPLPTMAPLPTQPVVPTEVPTEVPLPTLAPTEAPPLPTEVPTEAPVPTNPPEPTPSG